MIAVTVVGCSRGGVFRLRWKCPPTSTSKAVALGGAPFVPAIVRATGVLFEEKLFENHVDTTRPPSLSEGPDALAFGVAGLAVAEEDFGHGGFAAV